jgi:gliding motility-associated-like protein
MNKFPIILSLFFISFLIKTGWSQCESYSTDNHVACDSFTWIDGVTYTSSNNTAVFTLVGANAAGCDSIVTLNLTINNSSSGIDVITACDSFTWIDGVTYNSSNNTAVFTLVGANAAGCDSIVTLNLVLKISSTNANLVTSSDSLICENSNVTLNVSGGSLGTNSQWVWYKDSCSGNSIDTGSSINVTQASNTTYFVRAEGDCNNTSCVNVTVENLPYFIDLDSLSIDSTYDSSNNTWSIIDSVCPQSAVQLFAHYSENFPLGYSITWYQNSCGSIPIGIGDSITVYPDSTTIYYARVIGTCGASLCKNITVFTKDGSISPYGISASSNNFCNGGSTTLSVVGGQLGTGASWGWYKGSCGGNFQGSGSSKTVTPNATTTYYVRANGGACGATSCAEILINTYDLNVYHSPIDSTCESSPFVLQGGFPQGGNYSGNGITDSIFDPSVAGFGSHTITYSFTDSNNCSNSTQFPVVILEANIDPVSISSNAYEICNGNSTTINLDNSNQIINGSQWVWYQGSCGTGQIIGTSTTNNQITVSPSTTTNFYVRAEGGLCPASNCIGVTIDVYTLETHLIEFDDICGEDYPVFELIGGSPSGGVFSGAGVENGFFNPKNAGIGTHNITYTYSLGPCVATDVENIQINNSPLLVNYSIEQETCSEGGIMIHAHVRDGLGYYGYEWSDGSLENPLTYAENNIYSVLVSDANNCYTLLDNIVVDSSLNCIEIVNTFSPNGDGINDFWNLNFPNYSQVNLIIFNKWGNQIKEFSGSNSYQWDGKTLGGKDLPAGTYYYVIELDVPDGPTQNGPITIIR